MKFTAEFYDIRLMLGEYRETLMSALVNANERAGQAWINATVKGVPIPTWGGASRATFQKLAFELGTSVPIGPIRGHNTVASGLSHSVGSGVEIDGSELYAGFVYTTTLRGLIYNEYNKAVKGPYPQPWSNNVRNTPYNFQNAGEKAWLQVAKTIKLPSPYNSIRKTRM